MKLCSFTIDDTPRLGCVVGESADRLVDVTEMIGSADMIRVIDDHSLSAKIEQFVSDERRAPTELTDVGNVHMRPPIARPGKIVCLAGNYAAHIAESGFVEPEARANFTQQLFLKPSSSLVGDREEIQLSRANHRVGWETELAVVIGKRGKNVSVSDASEHVFGYTILNDISERGLNSAIKDRHLREMDSFCDWLAGKWFDGFAPCGPWIVTKDELPHPHELEIKFYLNGELRQHGSTLDMIFSIPEQISYISSIMTLEPGDIISTGTPAGAGVGDAKTTLDDGDELVCEIEGIGKLRNTVRWTG